MRNSRGGWTVLLVVSAACASSRPVGPARQPMATSEGSVRTTGLKLPKILQAMPEGDVLDLGPVLVPEDPARESPQAVLLAAADRLGADAFVFESRGVGDVYRIRREAVQIWRDRYTGDYFEARVHVYEGPLFGSAGARPTNDTGCYRAIRHLKHTPAPCSIDAQLVGDEPARLLAGELPFKEQIRVLNVLFAQGLLKREAFQTQRLRCLEQLDREEEETVQP